MRKKKHEHSTGYSEEAAFELGVLYTTLKDDVIAFVAKEGNPYSFADVASRLAKLFQAEAVREQLRSAEYLSQMRQNGAGNYSGRPPQSGRYELAATSPLFAGPSAGRPLRRPMSEKARKLIGEAQRKRWAKAKAAGQGRDYSAEYWSRKARKEAATRTKADGTPDLRSSSEARAKRVAEMAKRYRDPKWRKKMLKHMAAMRARKRNKPKPMSEETKAKLRAARYATLAAKKAAEGVA